jgi:hypothetical protein
MSLLVGQRPSNAFINYWARLLAVVLLILAGASPLASWQAHTEPLQVSPSTVVSAVAGSPESGFSSVISTSEAAVEQEDTDPTDLGLMFGVVCISVLILRSAGLLSAFYEGPAKLSSNCFSVLEQPG